MVLSNIVTMAVKDLKLLWRDKLGLFWSLGFPLIMALFFGSVFGGKKSKDLGLRVVALDQDQSKGSQAFMDSLKDSKAIRLTVAKPEWQPADLRQAVLKGRYLAYLIIPKGFGKRNPFNPSDKTETLKVGMDPSRQAEAGYLQGLLAQATMQSLSTQFQDPSDLRQQLKEQRLDLDKAEDMEPDDKHELKTFLNSLDRYLGKVEEDNEESKDGQKDASSALQMPMSNGVPITLENLSGPKNRPASAYEVSFPSGILWAILGTVASFTISLVKERKSGTLFRLHVAPHSAFDILAGKALACMLSCMAAALVLTVIGALAFGVRIQNPVGFVLALLSLSFCFVGIMLCLSVLGDTEESVAGSSWGVMLIMSMLGGGMVPLLMMPSWMIQISHFSPVKWGILSLEGAIWRGFSVTDLVFPCLILNAVGLATLFFGTQLFRRSLSH